MAKSTWEVAEPEKLTFDDPLKALNVRIVNGTVNVVGTDEAALTEQGGARLEISHIEGPPLIVTLDDGTLTVAYEDLPWKGFLKWLDRQLDRKGQDRSAVVSSPSPPGRRSRSEWSAPAPPWSPGCGGVRTSAGSPATRRSWACPARSAPTPCPAAWKPRRSPEISTSSRSRAI